MRATELLRERAQPLGDGVGIGVASDVEQRFAAALAAAEALDRRLEDLLLGGARDLLRGRAQHVAQDPRAIGVLGLEERLRERRHRVLLAAQAGRGRLGVAAIGGRDEHLGEDARRLVAAHAAEQLEHEARALEIRVECKLLEALGRLLGDLEAAERVQRGLRERAVRRLGGLHQRVDDLGARLVGLEREAEGDDRLLAHARVLLLVVGVREERGHGLLVLEVAEDLDRGGDGAVRVLLLLLRLEELLGLGEVAAPLVTVGVLDLLAHGERRRLRGLAVARGEALDERRERVLAAELGERGVERASLLRARRGHLLP